jgi:hypothetical protein
LFFSRETASVPSSLISHLSHTLLTLCCCQQVVPHSLLRKELARTSQGLIEQGGDFDNVELGGVSGFPTAGRCRMVACQLASQCWLNS